MMHVNTTQKKAISSIGEEIGLELGLEFIKNYQTANPVDNQSFIIGKEILAKILNQSNCQGLEIHLAINEFGQTTLVYNGLDQHGKAILAKTSINNLGNLVSETGIVGDRTERGGRTGALDNDNGTWETE